MKSRAAAFPYLLWMVIFTVVPLMLVVYFALTSPTGAATLQNLSDVRYYTNVILRSIWLAAIATVVCLLIAYPLAWIMSRLEGISQRTLMMLVMLPMWMNFLLRTYAWMTLLENTGIINRFLSFLGFGSLQMINTPGAVVLGMVYNYVPFMVLPLYSVMTKIGRPLIQAAQDLGADSRQVFGRVVLPLSIPGITAGVNMVFVPAVSTFIISRMLGGGTNLMIGDLIELQFLGAAYNPNLGAAISMVLMVMMLVCMSLLNQFDDDGDREGMIL